jgi:hypothetical protein
MRRPFALTAAAVLGSMALCCAGASAHDHYRYRDYGRAYLTEAPYYDHLSPEQRRAQLRAERGISHRGYAAYRPYAYEHERVYRRYRPYARHWSHSEPCCSPYREYSYVRTYSAPIYYVPSYYSSDFCP